MRGTEADHRDDLGEMHEIGERLMLGFLPPPDRLVRREEPVKVAAGAPSG
jgi:hypothetical protein